MTRDDLPRLSDEEREHSDLGYVSIPAAPEVERTLTIHVDGDLEAVPLIKDLTAAGLKLVQEGGKTWLRKVEPQAEADETRVLQFRQRKAAEKHEVDPHAEWHAACVREFAASVRPIEGVCFCDYEPLHTGRGFIERLALSIEGKGEPPTVLQCVDMLDFLSNVQPLDKQKCYACGGQGESVGFNIILDRIAGIIDDYHGRHG